MISFDFSLHLRLIRAAARFFRDEELKSYFYGCIYGTHFWSSLNIRLTRNFFTQIVHTFR